MTNLLINIEDKDQESILLTFLNSHKYEYHIIDADNITVSQKEEILQRECDFKSGKIKTAVWEDARKQFLPNQ
jgi:hypothetical protein